MSGPGPNTTPWSAPPGWPTASSKSATTSPSLADTLESLAQLRLGDLSHGVLRQRLLDVHLTRHLVAGQGLAAVLDEVLGHHVKAGPERDEGHRLLAEDRIGLPDDRGLEHRGDGIEDVLDLLRVDVLPAPDDQVLDPVDQGQIAVVVEPADITGVQPAAAQDLRRLLRPAEVAAHDVRPADDHLARLPGGQQPVSLVHHPDVDAGYWQADAARLAYAVHGFSV